jgi:hypothetical protein
MALAFKHDTELGEWQASLDGYYHAVGTSKDEAVKRLGYFLQVEHPDVFAARRSEFDEYWKPVRAGGWNVQGCGKISG